MSITERLEHPDHVMSAEYRAIYDLLEEGLSSEEGSTDDLSEAILDNFIDHARYMKSKLAAPSEQLIKDKLDALIERAHRCPSWLTRPVDPDTPKTVWDSRVTEVTIGDLCADCSGYERRVTSDARSDEVEIEVDGDRMSMRRSELDWLIHSLCRLRNMSYHTDESD